MHMLPRDIQETNERRFSRNHINGYIKQAINDSEDIQSKVDLGVSLLQSWLEKDYYKSKNKRLEQLKTLDLRQLVTDMFVGIAYIQQPQLFVSVTSQLAAKLNFADHRAAILTVAEITAVICETDAFDITKDSPEASLMLISRLTLPKAILEAIERSMYQPPMVCQPEDIQSNFESPYLTFNDSQILGKKNSHEGDICLDVINIQNKIELELDTEFLCNVEEVPNHALDTYEKLQQWQTFKDQSYGLYHLLVKQGNSFYLTNKVDKRGRLYSQGYHVTSQGTCFKKAMLELKNKETVTGVPV